MNSAELWVRLWLLASAYPWLAALFVALLSTLGTLFALALVSLARPELPLHQWEDDDDQHRAVSRRMPLL